MHLDHELDSRITIVLLAVLYSNLSGLRIKIDLLYYDYGN